MEWIIYKHTNKIDGKSYVGQTKRDAQIRWQNGNGYKNNPYFYNAIEKYGWNNFSHEIIEKGILTQEVANDREIFWIAFYNSYEYGYNLTKGGSNGEHMGVPVLQIDMSTKQVVNTYPSIADASRETKTDSSQISRCCYRKEKNISANGFYWCFEDEYNGNWEPSVNKNCHGIICIETGEKFDRIIDALDKYPNAVNIKRALKRSSCTAAGLHWAYIENYNENYHLEDKKKTTKKIICIETKKIYDSMIEAAKEYSILPSELSRACSNSALTAKGLHWSYLENYNDNYVIKEKQIPKHGMKYVQCIETQKVYSSITDASGDTGVDVSSIIRVCKGKALTAGGCHWRYVEKIV